MKKLGLTIGVIVGVSVLAPKVVGNVIENKYEDIIKRFADHPSIEIVDSKFTKNWFSGESIVTIKFKDNIEGLNKIQFEVKDSIHFGPLIVNDGLSFNLATSTSTIRFDKNLIDEGFVMALNDKLTIKSAITYGLDYVNSINLQQITSEHNGHAYNIKELTGEFILANETHLTGELNWLGGNVTGPEVNVSIAGAVITLDQEVVTGDIFSGNALMSGNGVFKFPEIIVQTPIKEDIFSLKNFSISASSTIDNNLMDMELNYHVNELNVKDTLYNNANFDMIINHLDTAVLLELNPLLSNFPKVDELDETQAHQQKIIQVVTKLLDKEPKILIPNLSVETPDGKIEADMDVSIDNSLFNSANPMSIMVAAKVNAQANGPELFFEKLGLKAMIDTYVQQGFLVRDNSDIGFKLNIEQRQLTVNEKVLPL